MPETLQEFADLIVEERYRQPLKTLAEALAVHGWPHIRRPRCCGQELEIRGIVGRAYLVHCDTCGRFAASIDGPKISPAGTSMQFLDRDHFPENTDWDRTWIAGRREDG